MAEPVIKTIDKLGRLVIPLNMRRDLRIETGDDVLITENFENLTIVLRRATPLPICGECGRG